MTKDNRLCLFREHYKFQRCLSCTGYPATRDMDCQHYLPRVQHNRQNSKQGCSNSSADTPIRSLDEIRRISDNGAM